MVRKRTNKNTSNNVCGSNSQSVTVPFLFSVNNFVLLSKGDLAYDKAKKFLLHTFETFVVYQKLIPGG